MNVNTVGFKLKLRNNVSIADLLQELEALEDKEITIYGRIHVPYVDVVNNLLVGLVLSYRSSKKSLISERDSSGDLIVRKSELKDGEHSTEVGIFCINPETLKGLLYCYFGSVTVTGFGRLLNKAHSSAFKRAAKEYKRQLTDFNRKKDPKLQNKINKHFSGGFSINTLSTPSDLNSLVGQFDEIESIFVKADDMLEKSGRYVPLEPYAESASLKIDFSEKMRRVKGQFVTAIKQVFNRYDRYQSNKFLLVGIGHNGEEISRILGENNDEFGKMPYDDYVEKLPKRKWKLYKNCTAMKELLNTIDSYSAVFGAPPTASWKRMSVKDLSDE